MSAYRIEHYLTATDHRDLYIDWLRRLRDVQAKVAVIRRVGRVELGNFGDHKFCRDGVWELRIDAGLAIPCTTLCRVVAWCCCCAVATSERRIRTSAKQWRAGKTGNGERKMKSRSHDDAMAELYRSDPALALEVINGILEDGDQAELLIVLRQLAQAFGGVQAVAEQAHLNPTQLYRTLSPKGNPALSSLSAILKAMGLRLAVQPLVPPARVN
jgi:probable addiction module antidote protein